MESKLTVVGLEVMEGVSKKSGNAYSMGRVHTLTDLAPPMAGAANVAVGQMGDVYDADPALVHAVKHLPCPFSAIADLRTEMRFGERRLVMTSLKPVSVERKQG